MASVSENLYNRGCINQDISQYEALMTVAQNLTDAEKAQVFTNLGIDPASFGSMAYLNYEVVGDD